MPSEQKFNHVDGETYLVRVDLTPCSLAWNLTPAQIDHKMNFLRKGGNQLDKINDKVKELDSHDRKALLHYHKLWTDTVKVMEPVALEVFLSLLRIQVLERDE